MNLNNYNYYSRVRVLILGGGIHGVGILHDLATRGWRDVLLVERFNIGSQTSSASTKLIHGGLRYLQNIFDYGLVFSALHERNLLVNLLPDLVFPAEFYLPVLKNKGYPSYMIKSGLMLYDWLAGFKSLGKHRKISFDEAKKNVPYLKFDLFHTIYSYWDAQTDDLALVKRVALSAKKLGVEYWEHCYAEKIYKDNNGWIVELKCSDGQIKKISARYVVNALGPWSHQILYRSNISPPIEACNIKGIHLLFDDIGHKNALFLQSIDDGRIFFVIPWKGYTLVGTTESLHDKDPDLARVESEDVDYLLSKLNFYFSLKFTENDIKASFCGLRWLPTQKVQSFNAISRSDVVKDIKIAGKTMYIIYGGKLTTYRQLSKRIGDLIVKDFGQYIPSGTNNPINWITAQECNNYPDYSGLHNNVIDRFRV